MLRSKLLYNIVGQQAVRQSCMNISTTSPSAAGFQKSFKTHITSTNPLIDGPDYTYTDGRPTPLRKNQKFRAIAQKEAIERAFQLTKEIEFAVDRFQNMTREEKMNRSSIIDSKFTEKEVPLTKSK